MGSHLEYYGAIDPGSIWEVVYIKSYERDRRTGQYRYKYIQEVRTQTDDITLRCISDNPETRRSRTTTFGYLRYSAIWRTIKL